VVKVFISHSHSDKPAADALQALILDVFTAKYVTVSYSSDRKAGGGITAGDDWLDWILTEVRESAVCIVMLTSESIGKPWLMWEAGAVSGVALANENTTPIVPLLFRISNEQVPGPLRSKQAEYGTSEDGIQRVLQMLHQKVGEPPERFLNLAIRDAMPRYLKAVDEALRARPMALSEAAVQEWSERLDELRRQNRSAEVRAVHRAMLRVFLPAEQKDPAPLDIRLHRRLGDMYLAARDGANAAIEFELALRLTPNDPFLQHRRTLAELDAGNAGRAGALLAEAEAADPTLITWNPEFAGLKGRIFRDEWKRTGSLDALRKARDAYWQVMEKQPDSYYMADNVGQLSLALGEPAQARQAFERAVAIIERLKERSVWSLATLATASFGLEKMEAGLAYLQQIRGLQPAPTARELQSIEEGLSRMRDTLTIEKSAYDAWVAALRPLDPTPPPG
jgi:tetratricopeptide (TPR) repeat protein